MSKTEERVETKLVLIIPVGEYTRENPLYWKGQTGAVSPFEMWSYDHEEAAKFDNLSELLEAWAMANREANADRIRADGLRLMELRTVTTVTREVVPSSFCI